MANFSTIADVIEHALFRAGEFTAGTLQGGDYYNGTDGGPVLRYINDTLQGLLLGSPIGLTAEDGRPMPAVDWWWARKNPPATLFLSAPYTTGTVSVVKGGNALIFSQPIISGGFLVNDDPNNPDNIVGVTAIVGGFLDITGWRIRIGSSRFLPRIASVDNTGTTTLAIMDSPWPDDTATNSPFTLVQIEYTLPTDFLRFTQQPTLSSDPWRFDVLDLDALDQAFPISSLQQGRPQAAALIAPQKIRLSHYPLDVDRVEYTYIFLPTPFMLDVPGNTPQDLILPPHYRRALALGAAFYILYDKADSKAGDVRGEFQAFYRSMMNEHMRHQRKMSKSFGRINYRLGQVRGLPGQGPLRTSGGLIIAP